MALHISPELINRFSEFYPFALDGTVPAEPVLKLEQMDNDMLADEVRGRLDAVCVIVRDSPQLQSLAPLAMLPDLLWVGVWNCPNLCELWQMSATPVSYTHLVLRYLSAMKYCAAVIGNSSSGVVETPTLGVPAVNIGRRQEGRILCPNVICCDADEKSIRSAVEKALTPAFAQKAKTTVSPYNGGDTSRRMVRGMEHFLTGPRCGKPKIFYDGE